MKVESLTSRGVVPTQPLAHPLWGVNIGLFIHYIYYVTTFPLQNKQPVVILLVDTEVTFYTYGA
jgi:hypothetical protein